MKLSDSHQFIFIHIRKAAGGSVNTILNRYSLPRPRDFKSRMMSKLYLENNYRKFAFRQHCTILDVKRVAPIEVFDAYFKFAFVRNPWKRLVSEYEFIRRQSNHGRHSKVIKMDFDTYINYQASRKDAHQINMLANTKGALLMDFVGRFENLHKDWEYACSQIGIDHHELPHLKNAKIVDYDKYYNQANKERVAQLWKHDIDIFEYTYDD